MSKKLFLCDFNDSFTYKIYSELLLVDADLKIEVIDHKNLLRFFQNDIHDDCKIILGPGPGHPKDYEYLYPSLQKIMNNPKNFILGICLGHQLIWSMKGFTVSHCIHPRHGYTEKFKINNNLASKLGVKNVIYAQRYNSLAVKISKGEQKSLNENDLLIKNDELIISALDNFISYQFHPESVGTSERRQFFKKFLEHSCV